MAGSNYSYESEFYSWLSDRIKPAQLSSVYEAFAQVNKFCLMRKVLTRPLFETDDINVLKAIQQTIDYNKIFRFTHRRYLSEMSAGIRQYIEYIKTHRKEETVPLDTTGKVLPPQEAKPVSMDPLISLILDAQIEFIDHRDKGGALWILGAENNKSFVNKCAQRGIVFRFKPEGSRATGGTAAWWTKYGTEKTPAKETDIKSSEPVNTDHSSEVLLPFRFNFQVQEQPVDANGEKIQPVSHNHDTEVVELLRDSIFDPLCEALAEEHVYTIEDLKKIRLWPFMNQHNLYTIATRQIVLTRVRELLSPVMQVEDGRLFRLHCGDAIYEGETASIAFLRYCENLAHRFPLKIRTLLGKNAPGSSLVALHQTNIQGNPLKMENPTAYIQEDLTSEDILLLAAWLGKACGCLSNDIKIEGQELSTMAPETLSQKQSDTAPPLQKLSAPARENKCSAMDQLMINKMESAVMQSDMTGLDFDELRDILRETMTETKRLVALAKHIVEIKGRLYHEDALIDWTEGADQLESIMDKLMQKNNGYISAAQLYEYAHADMNMFLNDNDINDVRSVYDIAQHLFEKNAYHGKRYAFTGKSHIATSSDVSTNFDVCCKYAEDQGGFFALSDLKEYLTSVGIKTGNLRAQLKLYDKPFFLYYEAGVLVLAKILQIDEKWLDMVRAALDKLFSDVGDHIILREIRPFWFEQLPALPNGRPWTPLMLQSVLRFYSEELGARTIIAMEYQSLETLHTMLVRSDSPIRNFGDVVISYIVENKIDQRSFEAEELRKILVESGIIQGNELIWNMAKALGNDERFAWNIDGNHVTIRV